MADQLDCLKAALSDRYRIERELGSGGMVTVYLAEDLKLHSKVALKVLRPDLAAALGPTGGKDDRIWNIPPISASPHGLSHSIVSDDDGCAGIYICARSRYEQ